MSTNSLLQELWTVEQITHETWLVGTDGDLRWWNLSVVDLVLVPFLLVQEEEMLVEELLVLVPFLLVQEEVMLELYVEELLVLVLQYGVGDGCCHGFSLSSWLEKRGLTCSASNACLS